MKTRTHRISPNTTKLASSIIPSRSAAAGAWTALRKPPLEIAGADSVHQRKSGAAARRDALIASSIVILVVELLGCLNLLPVYGSVLLWLVPSAVAALIGIGAAWMAEKPSLRLWGQLALLLAAQFIVGPAIALPDTLIGHVIPTASTIATGAQATVTSYKYIISINPPVGIAGGSLMALWTICLWSSFLAALFAFLAIGPADRTGTRTFSIRRVIFLAASDIALAAELIICILLGTVSGFTPGITGAAIVAIVFAWNAWQMGTIVASRRRTALISLGVIAALLAAATSFATPTRTVLRDTYDPPINPANFTSPLSQLRSFIKDHKNETLVTAYGLPAKTPVRLAVMDAYNGTVWNLSDSTASSSSGDYRLTAGKLGEADETGKPGKKFTVKFTIGSGFDKDWLPMAGIPQSMRGDSTGADKLGSVYYNSQTGTVLYPSGAKAGLTYTLTADAAPNPSTTAIDNATVAAVSQPAAKDIPAAASQLADAWTQGKGTTGLAARSIAEKLKTGWWFSNGLTGDYPSLPGHSNYRLTSLLDNAKVGNSEQYAAAMALMARQAGLPSRVVLGFIPKDKDGNLSAARTVKENGTTVTRFTGNDIEAWTEIKLHNYGWVAFYPTPPETKAPDKNQDLTPPNPQKLVRQPGGPLKDPIRDTNSSTSKSLAGSEDADDGQNQVWATILTVLGNIALYGSPLWILLIIAGILLLLKAVARKRWSTRGTPAQRIENGWDYAALAATWSGVHVRKVSTMTRMQQAKALAQAANEAAAKAAARAAQAEQKKRAKDAAAANTARVTAPSNDAAARNLARLAAIADYAQYAEHNLTEEQAQKYWSYVDDAEQAMQAQLSKPKRLLARLNPRGILNAPMRQIRDWLMALPVRVMGRLRRGRANQRPHNASSSRNNTPTAASADTATNSTPAPADEAPTA